MTHAILAASNWFNFSALIDFISDLRRSHRHAKDVRITIRELSKLTDRELNDIGLSRGDIYWVAHETHHTDRSPESNRNLKGWV